MEEAFIKKMKTGREIVLGGRLRRISMFSPVGFDRPGRCQVAAVTGSQSTQPRSVGLLAYRSSLKGKRVASLLPSQWHLFWWQKDILQWAGANWQDLSDMRSGWYGQRTEHDSSAGRVTLGMCQTPVGGLSFAEK